nr:glycine zipper family protein [uncultured Dongia sp.]
MTSKLDWRARKIRAAVKLTMALSIGMAGGGTAALAQAPISYPGAGQSLEQQAKDEAECRSWATQQTGVYPYQAPPQYYGNSYAPSGNIVRGAAGGAMLGAVGGAIGGDTGKGAAIGAGVGATAGLLKNGRERRNQARANDQAAAQYQAEINAYNGAFAACMQGRGYTVR